MKVAFLDRDGTIIKDYPDVMWQFIKKPDFITNSIEALKEIKRKGYEIIVITNQYLISDGIISLDDYYRFSKAFEETLSHSGVSILSIYFCPHNDSDHCQCKKPKTGMIEQALMDYPLIDLSQSFIVGDSDVDLQLAQQIGMQFYGIHIQSNDKNTKSINSLFDVLAFI